MSTRLSSDHADSGTSSIRLTLFEDRYGIGAHERLVALLRQPCVSFAAIASRFGVTRERVRQWHQELMPDAPTGHARRRLCRQQRHRQELAKDPLLRAFVHDLRNRDEPHRLTPIPVRSGYQKRAIRVDGHLVALRRAGVRRRVAAGRTYALPRVPAGAAFVYFELSAGDFLFVPRDVLPNGVESFVDVETSAYARYKNSFAALRDCGDRQPVSSGEARASS